MMIIENISHHLDMLPAIAAWHRDEWGSDWEQQVLHSINKDKIPTIYVAIDGNNPVGTAMLVNDDMITHPELSPWLGGVYVKKEYRGRGIGLLLSQHAMQEAARMGINQLWLYTTSARKLYEKLGWQYVTEEHYLDESATIMNINLAEKFKIDRQ
jgi:GNAT superfamily N-acetyltransferase